MIPAISHLIVDRDGVLNVEEPGRLVGSWEDWRWVPGSLEALVALDRAGVAVSVVTNQSAIGLGRLTTADVDAVHAGLADAVERAGARAPAVLACPHAPGDGCACRKPLPGMVCEAVRRSGIPIERTLLVGDDRRDLEAGRAAGVAAALVRTGKGAEVERTMGGELLVFDDLNALVSEASGAGRLVGRPADAADLLVESAFRERTEVAFRADRLQADVAEAARCIATSLGSGGTCFAAGNGGSAADAAHFVAELVIRFDRARRPGRAVLLGGDPSLLTAGANDLGFDQVFARQLRALARPGDAFLGLSTSGASRNVAEAVAAAREVGCSVVVLTGQAGTALAELADVAVVVPSASTPRVQEVHALCLHAMALVVDRALLDPEGDG